MCLPASRHAALTRVRSKPPPTSSRRATISCTVPHSGMRARMSTGLVLMSSGPSSPVPLSSGRGAVHPDSPTCQNAHHNLAAETTSSLCRACATCAALQLACLLHQISKYPQYFSSKHFSVPCWTKLLYLVQQTTEAPSVDDKSPCIINLPSAAGHSSDGRHCA